MWNVICSKNQSIMKMGFGNDALITELLNYRITALITELCLTFSWLRPLSYRNQSIDLLRKSMDWLLYDNDLRHERVNLL